MTFWDHLDVLRKTIIHIACAVVLLMLLAFCFKDELFDVILAPKESNFCTYRFFAWIGQVLHIPGLEVENLPVKLINTQLSGQFLTHMSVSFYAGILLASPYILYQLFHFISPALYQNEKRYSGKIGVCCYIKRAEESVRYTHSVVFILHWISINYGMPYIGFRFKIGACCYTCVKRYQTSIRNRSMLLQS